MDGVGRKRRPKFSRKSLVYAFENITYPKDALWRCNSEFHAELTLSKRFNRSLTPTTIISMKLVSDIIINNFEGW